MRSEKYSFGLSWSWHTLHRQSEYMIHLDIGDDIGGDASGYQFRRIYTPPIMFPLCYYLQPLGTQSEHMFYIGLGIGTYWIEKKLDTGVITFSDNKRHFEPMPGGGVKYDTRHLLLRQR